MNMRRLFAAMSKENLAVGAVLVMSAISSYASELRVGAINWDCSVPASTFFGGYQTQSLAPEKFRDRTPYYAKVLGRDRIDYPVRILAEYEVEMRHAIDAGIDYFAYCWYDCTPVKGRHLVESALATADEHTCELTQARRFHLQSELRKQLGLCAILVCCQPYSDTELKALAEAMKEQCYEKVGMRPLLYLFESPWQETLGRLRGFCREAGTPEPYVVLMFNGDVPKGDYPGVDAFGSYACCAQTETFEQLTARSVAENAARARHGKPIVPHLSVGWDPSPRIEHPVPWCSYPKGRYAPPADGRQLCAAAGDLRKWIDANGDSCPTGHLLVFAWNEFEEGGWICPTWSPGGCPDLSRTRAFRKAVKILKGSGGAPEKEPSAP